MPAEQAVTAAFTLINTRGETPAAEFVAGVALLMLAIGARTDISIAELINKADRWSGDGDLMRRVSALGDYVQGELL